VVLDQPYDDGRVQTANVAVSASNVSANITYDLGRQQSFTQAAPNELKLGEGEKLVRAGHRLGGGVGMCEKEVGGGQTTRRAFAP